MVTRCVCVDMTFAALLEIARAEDLEFERLCERTGCCRRCRACEAYVHLTLSTGKTAFAPLKPREVERITLDAIRARKRVS